jgi:hypothetical protein
MKLASMLISISDTKWDAYWYCQTGCSKSTFMNSVDIMIMPCATFRTVPFQVSSSYNFKNCPLRSLKALAFTIAYIIAKLFISKWQHRQWGC